MFRFDASMTGSSSADGGWLRAGLGKLPSASLSPFPVLSDVPSLELLQALNAAHSTEVITKQRSTANKCAGRGSRWIAFKSGVLYSLFKCIGIHAVWVGYCTGV